MITRFRRFVVAALAATLSLGALTIVEADTASAADNCGTYTFVNNGDITQLRIKVWAPGTNRAVTKATLNPGESYTTEVASDQNWTARKGTEVYLKMVGCGLPAGTVNVFAGNDDGKFPATQEPICIGGPRWLRNSGNQVHSYEQRLFGAAGAESINLRQFGRWAATVTDLPVVVEVGTAGDQVVIRGGAHPGTYECNTDWFAKVAFERQFGTFEEIVVLSSDGDHVVYMVRTENNGDVDYSDVMAVELATGATPAGWSDVRTYFDDSNEIEMPLCGGRFAVISVFHGRGDYTNVIDGQTGRWQHIDAHYDTLQADCAAGTVRYQNLITGQAASLDLSNLAHPSGPYCALVANLAVDGTTTYNVFVGGVTGAESINVRSADQWIATVNAGFNSLPGNTLPPATMIVRGGPADGRHECTA